MHDIHYDCSGSNIPTAVCTASIIHCTDINAIYSHDLINVKRFGCAFECSLSGGLGVGAVL
jgi:hypothetical protein